MGIGHENEADQELNLLRLVVPKQKQVITSMVNEIFRDYYQKSSRSKLIFRYSS